MTKVLFIGHYRQASGIGQSARDYMRALEYVGIEVIARPFLLNGTRYQVEDDIIKMESRIDTPDYCIQYVLPHHLSYNGKCKKNIAIFCYETYNFQYSGWNHYLNLMDEIWVPSDDGAEQLTHSHVTPKYCRIVPQPIDLNKPLKYRNVRIPQINDDKFNFLFIGEANVRKNLAALIRCYNLAFTNEPVRLVIKTSKPGMNSKQCYEHVKSFIEEVKRNLRIKKLQDEIIITEDIPEHLIYGLHYSSNAFIIASHGEGVCLPALDSLACGKPVIGTAIGGLKKLTELNNFGVGYSLGPVHGMRDTFNNLYSAHELWANINEKEMIDKMKLCYQTADDTTFECMSYIKNHSYNTIGNRMLELINV